VRQVLVVALGAQERLGQLEPQGAPEELVRLGQLVQPEG